MHKQIIFSLTTALLFSSFAVAGGDITPAEEVVAPIVIEDNSAFYVGGGFGNIDQKSENINILGGDDLGINVNSLFLQAGYKYNEYLSFEARYWFGMGDADITQTGEPDQALSGTYNAWGVYVKPTYPIGDFSLYALLGYGSVNLETSEKQYYWNSKEFSWGLGASYELSESFSIFADYIAMTNRDDFVFHPGQNVSYPATADISIRTVNVGFSYKF